MPLTIDELLAVETSDDIRANIVQTLVALNIRADLWRPGGMASTLLTSVCDKLGAFSTLLNQGISSGYLPSATGAWLTIKAAYDFNVQRVEPTFATGEVTLTNVGSNIYSFDVGEVTFLNSTTKQEYTNTDPVALGVGPVSQTVGVQCTTQGTIGNAAPGQIDSLVTSMVDVTVGNAEAVAGQDEQSDSDLRDACMNKLGSLSVRGPRTAYKWAVSIAVNSLGNPVNINRVSVTNASHTGDVTVVLASPSGAPISIDVTAAAASIEQNARPSAVTVTTLAAAEVPYTASLTVWAKAIAGLSADTIQSAAEAALTTFFSDYDIGGLPATVSGSTISQGVFRSAVEGEIKAANAAIFAVDGAIDLALAGTQVATDATTVTVRLVNPQPTA